MRDQSNKNIRRYPPVNVGDRVYIHDAKIPLLNNHEARVIEAPQQDRSPHKAIYKVEVFGDLSKNNPWYVFRTEFRPV